MNVNHLYSLFQKELPGFQFFVMDVGGRDGLHNRWDGFKDFAQFILVEPDPVEAKRLQSVGGKNLQIVDKALWSKPCEIKINITSSPGCSSVLNPDMSFIGLFQDPDRFKIVKQYDIPATTINDFVKQKNLKVNFLKIDTQGSELEILKGASELKGQILGIETEVEFAKIYKDQPTFRDIDSYISDTFDLSLYDLRRTYWKRSIAGHQGFPKGQMIFGDALYLMSPETMLKKFTDRESLLTAVFNGIFIGMTYGYFDYCLALLKLLEGKIDPHNLKKMEKSIVQNFRFSHISNFFPGRIPGLFKLLQWMDVFFSTHHKGWASADQRLGNSKQA